MNDSMQFPDLVDVFQSVSNRDNGALKWGGIEPWVHAELFAEFNRRSATTSWVPFDSEVPYITFFPVQLPKVSNRDWKSTGAIKWIDLCLRSTDNKYWCWFEFKVRHSGPKERSARTAMEARNAFRQDVVALQGFDATLTADAWQNPDRFTVAYWFDTLSPYCEMIRDGKHHFISAFLQLDGDLDGDIWKREVLLKQIDDWKNHRCKQSGKFHSTSNEMNIVSNSLGRHSLLYVEW